MTSMDFIAVIRSTRARTRARKRAHAHMHAFDRHSAGQWCGAEPMHRIRHDDPAYESLWTGSDTVRPTYESLTAPLCTALGMERVRAGA